MSLVTQRISFNGGVSQQPDTLKLPNQVKEAINCYPDVTFGTIKRSGSQFIAELEMEGGDDCPYILDLRMTGANGSTSFVDSSSYNHPITAVGNAQIQGNELLLDGEGSHLITAPNEVFALGASDFRVEGEVTYQPNEAEQMEVFSISSVQAAQSFQELRLYVTFGIDFYTQESYFDWNLVRGSGGEGDAYVAAYISNEQSAAFILPDEKVAFEVLRDSNGISFKVGGVRLVDTFSGEEYVNYQQFNFTGDQVRVGIDPLNSSSVSFKGKIDNFKICKPEPSS
jgi:hypothetical protein